MVIRLLTRPARMPACLAWASIEDVCTLTRNIILLLLVRERWRQIQFTSVQSVSGWRWTQKPAQRAIQSLRAFYKSESFADAVLRSDHFDHFHVVALLLLLRLDLVPNYHICTSSEGRPGPSIHRIGIVAFPGVSRSGKSLGWNFI